MPLFISLKTNDNFQEKGLRLGAGMTPERLRKLKIDAIKLCVAFAYGVKHRLRNEHGFNYEDYNGVLPQRFYSLR